MFTLMQVSLTSIGSYFLVLCVHLQHFCFIHVTFLHFSFLSNNGLLSKYFHFYLRSVPAHKATFRFQTFRSWNLIFLQQYNCSSHSQLPPSTTPFPPASPFRPFPLTPPCYITGGGKCLGDRVLPPPAAIPPTGGWAWASPLQPFHSS